MYLNSQYLWLPQAPADEHGYWPCSLVLPLVYTPVLLSLEPVYPVTSYRQPDVLGLGAQGSDLARLLVLKEMHVPSEAVRHSCQGKLGFRLLYPAEGSLAALEV